jgi:hypothetical protein
VREQEHVARDEPLGEKEKLYGCGCSEKSALQLLITARLLQERDSSSFKIINP